MTSLKLSTNSIMRRNGNGAYSVQRPKGAQRQAVTTNVPLPQGILVNGKSIAAYKHAKELRIGTSQGKTLTMSSDTFVYVEQDDEVEAICTKNGILHMNLYPIYVIPAVGEPAVKKAFFFALGKGMGSVVGALMDVIAEMSSDRGYGNAFCAYMANISGYTLDMVRKEIPDLSDDNALHLHKICGWWEKNRVRRVLWNLTLTNKEIDGMRVPVVTVLSWCFDRAHMIYTADMDKCEKICQSLRMTPHPDTIKAGEVLRYLFMKREKDGWTCAKNITVGRRFPGFDLKSLYTLMKTVGVETQYECLYLPYSILVEREVCDFITRMVGKDTTLADTEVDVVISSMNSGKARATVDQENAIKKSLLHRICVITGAAGTGKTAVVAQIIENLDRRGESYVVCCPTGKAADRVRQMSREGCASTIHRLLYSKFSPVDHIIIDEVSMLELELFYRLIKRYPDVKRITLVGDVNQIPPIGWGSPMLEILTSRTVPTYYLTTNHRVYTVSGEIDGVILNANSMLDKKKESFEFVMTSNFFVMEGVDTDTVSAILNGCSSHKGVTAWDVTVITFYNESLLLLNKVAQDIWNPGHGIHSHDGREWRVGDRVMMKRNIIVGEGGVVMDEDGAEVTEQKEDAPRTYLMNGTEGMVTEVTHEDITVNFGKIQQKYLNSKSQRSAYGDNTYRNQPKHCTVDDLRHSYALTVDSAQGSEWKFVVIYVPDDSRDSSFTCDSRVYTMITRAKRCVWITGNVECLRTSFGRRKGYRCENLRARLQAALPHLPPVIIHDEKGPKMSTSIMDGPDMLDDAFYDD